MKPSKAPNMCVGKADAKSDKLDAYTCEYVLHHALFSANNLNASTQRYEGYTLKFESHTKCTADQTKKFTVNMNVKCKADDEGKTMTW